MGRHCFNSQTSSLLVCPSHYNSKSLGKNTRQSRATTEIERLRIMCATSLGSLMLAHIAFHESGLLPQDRSGKFPSMSIAATESLLLQLRMVDFQASSLPSSPTPCRATLSCDTMMWGLVLVAGDEHEDSGKNREKRWNSCQNIVKCRTLPKPQMRGRLVSWVIFPLDAHPHVDDGGDYSSLPPMIHPYTPYLPRISPTMVSAPRSWCAHCPLGVHCPDMRSTTR
jgi:hypothetical protein